eukprot:9364203-Pyramimonas_sp.AAC.1
MGLDFNAFLPRTTSKSGAAAIAAEDEFEAMEGMMQKHATVSGILGVRLSSLQAVANCCARQDTRGAVNALSRLVLIFGSGLGVWLQEGGGAVGARGLLVCSRAADGTVHAGDGCRDLARATAANGVGTHQVHPDRNTRRASSGDRLWGACPDHAASQHGGGALPHITVLPIRRGTPLLLAGGFCFPRERPNARV